MSTTRLRVHTAPDQKQYVTSTSVTPANLGTCLLYMLMSDGHYYKITGDPTGTGSLVCTDTGTTAPTGSTVILIDGN